MGKTPSLPPALPEASPRTVGHVVSMLGKTHTRDQWAGGARTSSVGKWG